MEPEGSLPHSQVPGTCPYPSWEANRFSAGQEIPRILWNPKVHCRIHKCPAPVPILSHLDLFHTPTPRLILSSHLCLGLPSCLFPSGFPHQKMYKITFPHTRYIPPHLILLDSIIRTV